MQGDLGPVPVVFTFLLLIGLPVLSAIDVRRGGDLAGEAIQRRALYFSVALSLSAVALITLGVAAWQRLPARELGWMVGDGRVELAWGLAVTALGLGLIWAITRAAWLLGLEESPVARLLMPEDAAEKRGFLVLSGVAAVCEEYVFRGFALAIVSVLTGSPWLAALLVSVSFGLAHGYQKVAGVVRAAALGFLLCVPTIWTGSLFPAIVGHFWINAAIGLGGWRYVMFEDEEPPLEAPPVTRGAAPDEDQEEDRG